MHVDAALTPEDRGLVDRFFQAMRTGPSSEPELMALFAEDAVLVEPFTGHPRTHQGKAAIRDSYRESWKSPPPDMKITLHRVDLDGDCIRTQWTCTSPAFPGPMRGEDRFTLRDGRIHRLETTVALAPLT